MSNNITNSSEEKNNSYFKYYTDCIKMYGFKSATKIALAGVGVKTFFPIKFPAADVSATVRTNIVWKEIEADKWESQSIHYLAKELEAGATIIDIGAWYGPYTLFCSKLVGPTGKVISFEPDPNAFRILQENVQKNNLKNVILEKECVSNVSGTVELVAEHFGQSLSTTRGTNDSHLNSMSVKTTTLDKYCQEHNIQPNGIKIDVEGAEALIIDGARSIIKNCCPWIFLEFHRIFMAEPDRIKNWKSVTSGAKRIIFLEGDACQYSTLDEVEEMPTAPVFRVLIFFT